MDSARRRATYEDLLQGPDRLIAEIIDGELIVSPLEALAIDMSRWWLEYAQ